MARARAEIAGWAVALAASVVVVAVVATSSDWLLYTDGDSVIVPMIVRSIALGQPQDWAMSPVLFLPETAMYALLSSTGLGMRAALTLNAVVNLLALYGAMRLVAGRRGPGRAPVVGAVLAFLAYAALALLEGPAASPGFQLALLVTTTTYYVATVVATVAVLGLVRRAVDGGAITLPAVVIAVVALVSTLTNPLFAVWSVAPVAGMLLLFAALRRIPWPPALLLTTALAAGAIVGYALRGFFAGNIVAAGGNYFRGDRWQLSRDYFGGVLAQTATTWHGMLWLAAVVALTVASAIVAVRAWRRREVSVALVGAVGALAPLATTVGAIALGSDADRYLQPWVFLPVLVLAVAPPRMPVLAPARRMAAAVGASILIAAGIVAASPALAAAATRDDADLACVVEWVEASGRTGAGQFWTVRAPKAALDDPARLIQVDHTMRVYTWLTNRADADGAEVTFLVQDAATYPFALPDGFSVDDAEQVPCGRYTITDFGDRIVPLGPPRD